MNILELITQQEKVQQWHKGFSESYRQLVTGLNGTAKNFVMASALDGFQKKIFILTPTLYHMTQTAEDLQNILAEEKVFTYPVNEVLAAEMAVSSPEARMERIHALNFLVDKQKEGILVTTIAAARKFLPEKETWQNAQLHFQIGMEVDFENLAKMLVLMGYEYSTMVERPGEFALRGSILDVFPLTSQRPIRVEFFDVEIDSLREFDEDTQRSLGTLSEVVISPATELVFSKENLSLGLDRLQEELSKKLAATTDKEQKRIIEAHFDQVITDWASGNPGEFAHYYADFLYQKRTTLFDYLEKNALVFVDDYARIQEMNRQVSLEEAQWQTMKLEEGKVFSNQLFGAEFSVLLKNLKQQTSFFSLFQKGMGSLRFGAIYHFTTHIMQQFFGQMPLLKAEMERWIKSGNTVVVLADNEEREQKLETLCQEWDIPATIVKSNELLLGKPQILIGQAQGGFEFLDAKLVVLSEKDIFNRKTKKRPRRTMVSNAERLKSYNELNVGDYVVHANHGIGQYIGMETIALNGIHQDYMTIVYQNDDKLFIPVTQLSLISKYTASDGKTPRINKLSDTKWAKTKAKVTKQVEDIADDLIALYAERESRIGYAFSPDTEYQQEFENAFPYTETEDQLRSTAEIKEDMEKARPMDRLLVGDVGFGKTEVALRAAFKAIADGKQVAFLVPTTILAQQHYETMSERFEGFPVNVGLLSRFRTKKEQNATIQELKKGQIDIVVGTHRLLSQDIEFQDIGLLVIDEEQRFGVKHKERLKQLKTQVDVLTLTATPIPRTLHMSMLGVRDLSVIETPPANRFPVQTYVMETNNSAVREAIVREIGRNGQVFYLYNRVDTIEQKVSELEQLVPEARIGYAHGQMSEVQLENVLYDFIEGEYDVLVTTTIIETGVDIPNANTLFVENADYMGLSTLYQLRGRVGRSNRVAYAYFMYQPEKVLNEVSEKRLSAMREFTELGSGFKIAMRDLSIRGAGNLLGAQQHGFIDAVGFEMYSQMLEDAVAKKRGDKPKDERTSVEIDIALDAYIPSEYITDEKQKIEIYKRIRMLQNIEEFIELQEDLIDRFGEYPKVVENLLFIGKLKMNAERALVERISRKKEQALSTLIISISAKGTRSYQSEQFFEALSATTLKATLGLEKEKMVLRLTIPRAMEEVKWMMELGKFIEKLKELKVVEGQDG